MKYPSVLDGLRAAAAGLPIVCMTPDASEATVMAHMADYASDLAKAHVFVFENLPVGPDGNGELDLPGLEADEHEMLNDGLIPLPFEVCWFEAAVATQEAGGSRETFGFLLRKTAKGFSIKPVRVLHGSDRSDPDFRECASFSGEEWVVEFRPGLRHMHILARDPLHVARYLADSHGVDTGTRLSGECGFVGYLLLMLCSGSTQIAPVAAPLKLNKARAKKGKAPIPDHAVVSVVPRDVARRMRTDGDLFRGELRASPRLHWRRSHRRVYAEGRVAIIPRTLVGYRAGSGEDMAPTHYKVLGPMDPQGGA